MWHVSTVKLQKKPTLVKARKTINAEEQDVKPSNEFAKMTQRSTAFSDDECECIYPKAMQATGWGNPVPQKPLVPTDQETLVEARRVHENWRTIAKHIPWENFCSSLQRRADEIKRLKAQGQDASWNIVFDLLCVPLK